MAYSKAYADNYARIDWSAHKTSQSRQRRDEPKGTGPFVMPDIAPFVSPIDYSVISSRSQLRDHERKHKVRQCGELKTAEDFNWVKQNPQQPREKALENAYRQALEKLGHL